MSIVPQYFEIREVGKTIKSSKKQYVWRFKLEGRDYTIELFNSVLSGKKKILQNGQTLYYDSKYKGAFQFPFTIGKNSLNIVQHGDKYELRINNQSFTHLWDQERTKRNFTYDNKEQNDPYKEKHYAENYEKSTTQTSRDVENDLKNNQMGRLGYDQGINNVRTNRMSQPPPQSYPNISGEEAYDAELQRAIEESKKEEELRQQKVKQEEAQKKKELEREQQKKAQAQQQQQQNKFDFSTGFDHGFQKYETNSKAGGGEMIMPQQQKQPNQKNNNNNNEFKFEEMFNNDYNNNNEFDFSSFGNAQPVQQQQQPPQQQQPKQQQNNITDLDDLLGGFDSVPQTTNTQSEQKNALDFFNDNSLQFGATNQNQSQQQQQQVTDMFGLGGNQPIAPQVNQNPPPSVDIFGGSSIPSQQTQQQQEQQQQPEKPKFIPNLGGLYGTNSYNQQAMMQQQMMMQQMMMMNQQQQQYQTGMNPMMGNGMGMGMGGNVGLPQQYGNNMMGGAQGGMPQQNQYMPNAYMTGMPNQTYNQVPSFQQPPNQYQSSTVNANSGFSGNQGGGNSTPFDLFS